MMPSARCDEVVAATRLWLERAVIGLNLCPFAKAVHVKGQIRYAVSATTTADDLLDDLLRELHLLDETPTEQIDTTLLIAPMSLAEFAEFTDFLDLVEVALKTHGYQGKFQVASFHPDYVFADSAPDDMANYTNRAPYPILHLLREESMETAIANFPDTATIYQRNIETLRRIGMAGWQSLWSNT